MLISKELLQTYKELTNKSISGINEQLSEFQKSNDKACKVIENVIEDGRMLEDETFLKCYDHLLSSMSNVNESLRKISIQLHHNDVEKNDPENIFRQLNTTFHVHNNDVNGLVESKELKNDRKESIEDSGSVLTHENHECNGHSAAILPQTQTKVSNNIPGKDQNGKDSIDFPVTATQELVKTPEEKDCGKNIPNTNDHKESRQLSKRSSSGDIAILPDADSKVHSAISTPNKSVCSEPSQSKCLKKAPAKGKASISTENKRKESIPKKEDIIPDEKVSREKAVPGSGKLPSAPQKKDTDSQVPKKVEQKKAGSKKKKSSATKKVAPVQNPGDKSLSAASFKKTSQASESSDSKKGSKICKNSFIKSPIHKEESKAIREPAALDEQPTVDEKAAFDGQSALDRQDALEEPPVKEKQTKIKVATSNQTAIDEATIPAPEQGNRKLSKAKNKCTSNFCTKIQEEFHFPSKRLTKKLEGPYLEGCITFVHNSSQFEFFLLDINDQENTKIINMKTIGVYELPIDPEEVFAIFDRGALVRVVISRYQDQKSKYIKVLLIDFGDIIIISSDTVKFRLSKEYREMQAQAIPAKWVSLFDKLPEKHKRTLEDTQNIPAKFFVVTIKNNVLDVILIETIGVDIDGQHRFAFSDFKAKKEIAFLTKNKYSYKNNKDKKNNCVVKKKKLHAKKCPHMVDPKKIESLFIEEDDMPSTSSSVNKIKKKPKAKSNSNSTNPFINHLSNVKSTSNGGSGNCKNLAEEVFEGVSWQKPSTITNNPLMALFGHCPKDEERICKHYNPKTGDCFKRGYCKKEHTLLEPNGWTKDQEANNALSLHLTRTLLFEKNEIYKIRPTWIAGPTTFYAHIIEDEGYDSRKFVWDHTSKLKPKLLKKPPQPFQMVLAYHFDNSWYRAQVEHSAHSNLYTVFYIDYGYRNNLPLCLLAHYDISAALFPAQAHLFHIGGVLDVYLNQEKTEKCKKLISDKFLCHEFNIKILRVCNDDVYVGFYGEYANFVKQLVKQGYMEKQRNALQPGSTK